MSIVETIQSLPLPVLNHWGYWFILAAAMLEATPLFGLVIPGQTIVLLGGFFVRLGLLDAYGVITAAALGAIVGDLAGYFLGRRYGFSFISKYGRYFFVKKEHFDKVQSLIHAHAGKTLIIGRFNSLTRAFAPFAAGSSHVPFPKFLLYNILGGVSWAICYVVLGIVFGESYRIASRYMGVFILIAFALSIGLVVLYRFINKRKHIFTKYHLYTLILNIFSLYLFSKMVEDVIDKEWVTHLDIWINSKMEALWNPTLDHVMLFITKFTNPPHLAVLSAALLGVLLIRKKWYYSWLLICSMLLGGLSGLLFKLMVHRVRPSDTFVITSWYSFPSGHAVIAVIFFSLLIYVFKNDIKNRVMRSLFIVLNIFLFLLIGFSRVYLNVHWFSDVLAGFSLGLFWLTLLILVFKIISGYTRRKDISFRQVKNNLQNYLKLAKALKADPRVPRISKILLGAAVGYFFLPFDIIPDFIPVIGHLDDLLIVPVLILLAFFLIPKDVYREHYDHIFQPKEK